VIVSKFGEEFDVNKILEAHDAELMNGLEDRDEMDFVQVNSLPVYDDGKSAAKVLSYLTTSQANADEDGSEDGSDDEMDEDDEDDAIAANNRMEEAEDFDFED